MRILMTGASGFIGRHLAHLLIQRGLTVVAATRKGNPGQSYPTGLEVLEVDFSSDPSRWEPHLTDIETVVHLAAMVPSRMDDIEAAEECLRINALMTLGLATASVRAGVSHFCYFSAGNAYSPYGEGRASEKDALFPSGRAVYYLGSKVLGEFYVDHATKGSDLTATILRPSSVYGVGMKETSVLMRFINAAMEGKDLNVRTAKYMSDYIYVDDVAEAAVSSIEARSSGIFNIGSGRSITLGEVAMLVKNICNSDSSIVFSQEEPKWESGFRALNNLKARRTWGWRPRSLRKGITEMRNKLYP